MVRIPTKINAACTYFNPKLLERELKRRGEARRGVVIGRIIEGKYRPIAPSTIELAFTGQGINRDVAKKIADYLGRDVLDLLAPWDPCYEPPEVDTNGVPWEWKFERHLTPGTLCANGLFYSVCRMEHRHTVGRFGRGKHYLLSGLTAEERADKHAQLRRHAIVSAQVGLHLHLLDNLTSTPTAGDEGWWVVDRWIDGEPLAQLTEHAPWPQRLLPQLMKDIAAGLAALHTQNIVLRELTPDRVWIARDDSRALLTDFELAKLQGAATVSADWPVNPYRAPEVAEGVVQPAADCFSWGQILYHVLTGETPPLEGTADLLARLGLPKRIWAIARDALATDVDRRPRDARVLATALATWKSEPT